MSVSVHHPMGPQHAPSVSCVCRPHVAWTTDESCISTFRETSQDVCYGGSNPRARSVVFHSSHHRKCQRCHTATRRAAEQTVEPFLYTPVQCQASVAHGTCVPTVVLRASLNPRPRCFLSLEFDILFFTSATSPVVQRVRETTQERSCLVLVSTKQETKNLSEPVALPKTSARSGTGSD